MCAAPLTKLEEQALTAGRSAELSRRARRPTVARTLCWLLLLIGAYFIPRGAYSNSDSHVALTYALVEQHTVRIDRYLEMSGTRVPLADKAVSCGPHTDVRRCTHYVSDKAPGVSYLAAAAYLVMRPLLSAALMPTKPGSDRFVLRFLLTLLAITLPCALFLAAYWHFLAALGGPRAATIVAVGYGFGSPALVFSVLMFSHALSAALLFGAFMLLFAAVRTGTVVHPSGTRRRIASHSWQPLAAGILAGYAIGCEYPAALIAALLGLYALSAPAVRRVRVVTTYSVGGVVGVLPLAIYNVGTFGSLFSQGYLHLTDPYYAHGMAQGIFGVGLPHLDALWGVTFSPYRGLFILSPWLLLSLPGFARMARTAYRREALLCAAICLSYFLFQVGYAFWDGGASVGPRHYVPALPFLALPVLFALQSRGARRLAVALIGFSATTLLLVLATQPTFPMGLQWPFVRQTLHDLLTGRTENNWGMILRLPGLLSLLPLLAAIALLARQGARRLALSGDGPVTENLHRGNGSITPPT